jgi:hypothetical protein
LVIDCDTLGQAVTRRARGKNGTGLGFGARLREKSLRVKAVDLKRWTEALRRYGLSGPFAPKPFPSYHGFDDPTLTRNGKDHDVMLDGSSLLEFLLELLQPRFEVHFVVASLDCDSFGQAGTRRPRLGERAELPLKLSALIAHLLIDGPL